MKEAVRLPQYGMGMIEGEIVEWKKSPGDAVEEDEVLAEVATAKVETELTSPYTGTLQEICVEAGGVVDVGTVIAWIET